MAALTFVSDHWWQQSIKRGHQAMGREEFKTATTHYLRSLVQAEAIIKLKRQSVKDNKMNLKMTNQVCLNSMYVCSCHNISAAYAKRTEWQPAQQYLESALQFIRVQIQKVGFYPNSDRCVDQLYQLCSRKMSQFLISRGISEQEAKYYLLNFDTHKLRNNYTW